MIITSYHGLVKDPLFGYRSYVGMVDESEDGMEEAGFATVGITNQTRDSVLVALLVEVEQL